MSYFFGLTRKLNCSIREANHLALLSSVSELFLDKFLSGLEDTIDPYFFLKLKAKPMLWSMVSALSKLFANFYFSI